MTARHAGSGRIADTALIDQALACAADIRKLLLVRLDFSDMDPEEIVRYLADRMSAKNGLLGRALALLEQIGEMGE